MIRIVLPLNSISYMIIDEIITFITSSKLLLQLCDICFNHGLIFEAFSLLLILYGSLNPFRLYHAYTLLFNFQKNPYVILRKYVAIISNFLYEHLHHYTYCSDICFNHGLIFEAFSLLLISYGS